MPIPNGKSQIALEFIIVYSFVLIVFILIFSVIALQRAASINQQEYSLLQLQSQNIVSHIDQAVQAGSGYSATVPLISGFIRNAYSLSISSTGVVIVSTNTGQSINAYGFSHARGLIINGTPEANENGIIVYGMPTYKGFITISNLNGVIYIDEPNRPISDMFGGATFTEQSNAMLNGTVYSLSGTVLSNSLVGFAEGMNDLNGNIIHVAVYTGSDGGANWTITPKSGNVSAAVDVFNGNVTTISNLVGWWPLDFGYESSIPDFGVANDPGAFNGVWMNAPDGTNFAAASFSGNIPGFVKVNSTQINNKLESSNEFTVIAWVYYKGPTSHDQGIFGDWPGSGGGLRLLGYCGTCTGNVVLYVDGNSISSNGVMLNNNTWEMVTAEYNGNTGEVSIYLNSTEIATNVISKNLNLMQSGPYYIGNDPSGINTFNGLITNVQFYSGYLTRQQISAAYASGASSIPLYGGLVGWWPLLNNTLDYSLNMNNGSESNMSYVNFIYNRTHMGESFATFNGLSNVIIPYSPELAVSSPFSVSLWFLSFNSPGEIPSGALLNSGSFDLSVCGNDSCSVKGIQGGIGSMNYTMPFDKNRWYNIIETFNNSKWTIYVNGAAVASGTYSGTPEFLNSGPLHIGSGLNGQIADVQVYNTMLTSQQAVQLYGQGLPMQYRFNITSG